MSTVFNVSSLFASWPAPKSNPWLERAPMGAHKQQFRAPAGRGAPRIGRGSGNRAQNAVSHEGVRQPITASCAEGHAAPLWAARAYLGDQLARHRRSLASTTAAHISSATTVPTSMTSILRV